MIFVIGVISRGGSPESRSHLPSRFHHLPPHVLFPYQSTVLLSTSCVSADPDEEKFRVC